MSFSLAHSGAAQAGGPDGLASGPLPARPAVALAPWRARLRHPAGGLQPRGSARPTCRCSACATSTSRSNAEHKAAAEERLLEVLGGEYDLIVLARYMQILSPASSSPASARRSSTSITRSCRRSPAPIRMPRRRGARGEADRRDRPLRRSKSSTKGPIIEQDTRPHHSPRRQLDAALNRSGATSSARCSPAPSRGTSRTACSSTAKRAPSSFTGERYRVARGEVLVERGVVPRAAWRARGPARARPGRASAAAAARAAAKPGSAQRGDHRAAAIAHRRGDGGEPGLELVDDVA